MQGHRHVFYEEAGNGKVNIYVLQLVAQNADPPPGCQQPFKDLPIDKKGRLTDPSVVERNDLHNLLSDKQSLAKSLGDGKNLLEYYGIPGVVVRSTDPRLFALGFSKEVGSSTGRGWSRQRAKEKAEEIIASTRKGKVQVADLSVREMTKERDGITDDMIDGSYIFRITGPDRSPSKFNMDEGVVILNVPDRSAAGMTDSGIRVYLYDRKDRKYKDLPPVEELEAILAQENPDLLQ